MTAFISGGHNPKGNKPDPGAVSDSFKEAQIVWDFKELVIGKYKKKYPNEKVITDTDSERLSDYLKRIETGNGSVTLEFHCDSAAKQEATGTTAIIANNYTQNSFNFAKELVDSTSDILKIKNRGVITESQSHRGSLGLMREHGTVALLELFFISNKNDRKSFFDNKEKLADAYVDIIYKYEKLI